MRIVVGLGNPGPEYRATRHNVGFQTVAEIRKRHGNPHEERGARSLLCRVAIGGERVLLARPQTFMNRSGAAVVALLSREKARPGDLLVVCDDMYLDVGTIRLRCRGSHGGHNGLRSIIGALGTQEFPRLRIGIGPPESGVDHAEFVLAPVAAPERDTVREMVRAAADCTEAVVLEGIEKAMTRFNRRPSPGAAGGGGEL